MAAEADADSVARSRRQKRVSIYETVTPEKKAYGARLRLAREIAGLSLTEAATTLGYSQPVQLSLMETGIRMPTLRVIVRCAELYGTTPDFLCGMAPDANPDPVTAVQREIAGRVTTDVRRLLAAMTSLSIDVVRELRPDAGRMERLAGVALEASTVLQWIRDKCPAAFDELPGGSKLVSKIAVAADLARGHMESVRRAQRATHVGEARFTFSAMEVDGDQPIGQWLSPLSPCSSDELLDED